MPQTTRRDPLARHYARCMAERLQGHPLVDATPTSMFNNFLQDGTLLYDVGYIDNHGRFQYAFSASHEANEPRNMNNTLRSLAPPRHRRYDGGDNPDDSYTQTIKGCHWYRSVTILEERLGADIHVLLPNGTPLPGEVGFNVSFSTTNKDGAGYMASYIHDSLVMRGSVAIHGSASLEYTHKGEGVIYGLARSCMVHFPPVYFPD